ncbi:HNH endonuclease [Mariniblastus sp.]|nr:HNH endonuclease [Mariniblastus sp.]
MIFSYPEQRQHRRHGPSGYKDYESYREWLRDEFCFRCIYCLKREAWGRVTGDFELDHFEPQSVCPDKALDYQNLVYACRTCNSIKNACSIGAPFETLHNENLRCEVDGRLIGTSLEAMRLIKVMDLNSPRAVAWRMMWSRIVGFPKDLPNLKRKQAPNNFRPEGIGESWFVKRLRNQLPQQY